MQTTIKCLETESTMTSTKSWFVYNQLKPQKLHLRQDGNSQRTQNHPFMPGKLNSTTQTTIFEMEVFINKNSPNMLVFKFLSPFYFQLSSKLAANNERTSFRFTRVTVLVRVFVSVNLRQDFFLGQLCGTDPLIFDVCTITLIIPL